MLAHQTLPSIWLMTDRRMVRAPWQAIDRLPVGGGVVLRHHDSDPVYAARVAEQCRARGLMLAIAGDVALARLVDAAMVHNPDGAAGEFIVSRSIHSAREARLAGGADLLFVSPLFATRSHPGARPLGLAQGARIAAASPTPAIALGIHPAERGREAIAAGFHGWAAIDAWTRRAD